MANLKCSGWGGAFKSPRGGEGGREKSKACRIILSRFVPNCFQNLFIRRLLAFTETVSLSKQASPGTAGRTFRPPPFSEEEARCLVPSTGEQPPCNWALLERRARKEPSNKAGGGSGRQSPKLTWKRGSVAFRRAATFVHSSALQLLWAGLEGCPTPTGLFQIPRTFHFIASHFQPSRPVKRLEVSSDKLGAS